MQIRRTEYANNTPEQVRDYLREALVIVDEIGVPDDLRALAFARACDWLASKQVISEQVAAGMGGMMIPTQKG